MYTNAAAVDRSKHHADGTARQRAEEVVGLLTPVCKAFGTDLGVELASLNIQVHGGMGFIEETGAAQHLRDSRIAPIYEGTNGIQAADLVTRKPPVGGGQSVLDWLADMRSEADAPTDHPDLSIIRRNLANQLDHLEVATRSLLALGPADPNDALAASTPYLRMFGLVTCGYLLSRSASAACSLLAEGSTNEFQPEFLRAKITTARLYATQLLPQAGGLVGAVTAGSGDLYAIEPKYLAG
jgi:hypothetical protein